MGVIREDAITADFQAIFGCHSFLRLLEVELACRFAWSHGPIIKLSRIRGEAFFNSSKISDVKARVDEKKPMHKSCSHDSEKPWLLETVRHALFIFTWFGFAVVAVDRKSLGMLAAVAVAPFIALARFCRLLPLCLVAANLDDVDDNRQLV